MNKLCLDCNKIISKKSTRCRICNYKIVSIILSAKFKGKMSGKNNPRYIDGRSNKVNFCIDCKLKQIDYRSKRCSKCKGLIHSKRMDGKKHPNYIDGRSYKRYPKQFNETLREQIRLRDNYECQNCHMTEEEHIVLWGRRIEIHHIDYNKHNCDESNLITLCKQDNMRANMNRVYWKNFYNNKIKGNCITNVS